MLYEAPYLCWPFSFEAQASVITDTHRFDHFVDHLLHLEQAIEKNPTKLKSYKIFKAPLNPELFMKLLNILSASQITQLDISDNLMLPEHHQKLIEFVETHPTLSNLNVSYTGVDAQCLDYWANHFIVHGNLKHFSIDSTNNQSIQSLENLRNAILNNNTIESYSDGQALSDVLKVHLQLNASLNTLQSMLNELRSLGNPSETYLHRAQKKFLEYYKNSENNLKNVNVFKERAIVIHYQFKHEMAKRYLQAGKIDKWESYLEKLADSQTTRRLLPDIYMAVNYELGEFLFTQAPLDSDIMRLSTHESKIDLAQHRSAILSRALACFEAALKTSDSIPSTMRISTPSRGVLYQEIKKAAAEASIRVGQLLLIQQSDESYQSPYISTLNGSIDVKMLTSGRDLSDPVLFSPKRLFLEDKSTRSDDSAEEIKAQTFPPDRQYYGKGFKRIKRTDSDRPGIEDDFHNSSLLVDLSYQTRISGPSFKMNRMERDDVQKGKKLDSKEKDSGYRNQKI